MERREKRMRVTGKHILLKGILGVYSLYAFAVLVMRLISYRPLPLPLLWIGEAGFAVSLMLLPNAVSAEDQRKMNLFRVDAVAVRNAAGSWDSRGFLTFEGQAFCLSLFFVFLFRAYWI